MTKRLLCILMAFGMVFALIPMSVFAKTALRVDAGGSRAGDHPVTYTGETVNICEAVPDETFDWTISISENSSTIGAILLVEYDPIMLECTAADEDMFKAQYDVLVDSFLDENPDATMDDFPSAQPMVKVNKAYPDDDNPINNVNYSELDELTSGKQYAIIALFSQGYAHGGIQIEGEITKLTFKWKNVPETDEVPLHVIVHSSYWQYPHEGVQAESHDPIDVVHGSILIGHDWGEPTWTWTGNDDDGYTAATATFVCNNNAEHTDTATTTEITVTTVEPTGDAPGSITYTATVAFDGETYTGTKVVYGYCVKVVTDYTKGKADFSSIDQTKIYTTGSSVTFTISTVDDQACAVVLKNGEGDYTRLICSTDTDGVHSFTVTVGEKNAELVLVFFGDANLNGAVNNMDATMIMKHTSGATAFTKDLNLQVIAADANKNGKANNVDATLIMKFTSGVSNVITWEKNQ